MPMYGIFTYIWLIFMANVGKYTIHGFYGMGWVNFFPPPPRIWLKNTHFFQGENDEIPRFLFEKKTILGCPGSGWIHGYRINRLFHLFL